jgi:hypothetical protein
MRLGHSLQTRTQGRGSRLLNLVLVLVRVLVILVSVEVSGAGPALAEVISYDDAGDDVRIATARTVASWRCRNGLRIHSPGWSRSASTSKPLRMKHESPEPRPSRAFTVRPAR